eukprot:10770235-Lingulodinium_polyedra.AAC.1
MPPTPAAQPPTTNVTAEDIMPKLNLDDADMKILEGIRAKHAKRAPPSTAPPTGNGAPELQLVF